MANPAICPNCRRESVTPDPFSAGRNRCSSCGHSGPVADFHQGLTPLSSVPSGARKLAMSSAYGSTRRELTGRELENSHVAPDRDHLWYLKDD